MRVPGVAAPAAVNAQRIIDADQEPGNGLTHGRTYDEQRFSPLDTVNDSNAERLGLSWYFDIPTARGMGAYREWVSEEETKAIHAYVIQEAHRLLDGMNTPKD